MDNFIYDTNDLNTIRGGGLLLLEAAEHEAVKILEDCTESKNIKSISSGASWALFAFQAETEDKALSVRHTVESYFLAHPAYKHATIMIDIMEAQSNDKYFVSKRDGLQALNRWRQMRSPSIAVPAPSNVVCAVDKVRPASKSDFIDEQSTMVSESVKARRDFGKMRKKDFYSQRTNQQGLTFTQDLTELSQDPKKGILNKKIAVIYIDGNDFGSISKRCQNKEQQKNFDRKVRKGQEEILTRLVKTAKNDKLGLWKTDEKNIRLETLLWGGDEIIWVVPAWLGWTALALFYEQAAIHLKVNKEPLTHAAGLVFCHHNAAIYRVKTLAENLAAIAKEKDRKANWFTYQVLESFDHVGMDLENHRTKQVEGITSFDGLLLPAEKMGAIEKLISQLKHIDFPKRKIYQILRTLREGRGDDAKGYIRTLENQPEFKGPLEKLADLFIGTDYAGWLHLMELWDYVGVTGRGHEAH